MADAVDGTTPVPTDDPIDTLMLQRWLGGTLDIAGPIRLSRFNGGQKR